MKRKEEAILEEAYDESLGAGLHEEMAVLANSRSASYSFLANIFNQRPDNSLVQGIQELNTEDWLSSFSEEGFSGVMREGVLLIQNYVISIKDISPETVLLELARDRTRLVRGIMKGYGPPPPYEFVYAGYKDAELLKEHTQARLSYAEAGVIVNEEVKNSPDFIGIELDFMRHLTQTEAQAWEEDRFDEACEMLRKQQAFLKDHLVTWVPRYCEEMFKEANLDFYRGIAQLTRGFVLEENEKVSEYLGEAEMNKAIK